MAEVVEDIAVCVGEAIEVVEEEGLARPVEVLAVRE